MNFKLYFAILLSVSVYVGSEKTENNAPEDINSPEIVEIDGIVWVCVAIVIIFFMFFRQHQYVDPDTHQPYFFNPDSGETTWYPVKHHATGVNNNQAMQNDGVNIEFANEIVDHVFGSSISFIDTDSEEGALGELLSVSSTMDPAGALRFERIESQFEGLKGVAERSTLPALVESGVAVLFENQGGVDAVRLGKII
jgi:hypothetical protein